jgi:hypothetical protein
LTGDGLEVYLPSHLLESLEDLVDLRHLRGRAQPGGACLAEKLPLDPPSSGISVLTGVSMVEKLSAGFVVWAPAI